MKKFLVFLALLLSFPVLSKADSCSIIQVNGNQPSYSCTISSTQAGDAIVSPNVGKVASITDTQGNKWVQDETTVQLNFWHALNIVGGPDTITVTLSAAGNFNGTFFTQSKISGIAVSGIANGVGITTSSPSINASVNNIVLGFGVQWTNSYQGPSQAGPGFTMLTPAAVFLESETVSTPGPVIASVTYASSVNWFQGAVVLTVAAPIQTPPVSEFQSVTSDCGSVASCQLSFSQASTPNDIFVVGIRAGSLTNTVSVSDSLGNTYKLTASQAQSIDGGQLFLFVAPNIFSGVNTITVSQPVAATLRIVAREYAGVSTSVDVQLSTQANSGTAPTANITTASPGDLVIGLGYSADVESWNPGAGFGDLDVVAGKFSMEDEVQQFSGPTLVSFSISASDPWAVIAVALRPTTAPNVTLIISGTALYDDASAILPGPVSVSQLQNPTTTMGIGTITSDTNGNLSGSLSVNPNWTDANGNLTFLFGLPILPNVISYPVPVGEFQHNSTGLTINLVLFKQGALAIKSQTLAVTP